MRVMAIVMLIAVAAPVAARPPAYQHKARVTLDSIGADQVECWNDGMKAMNDPKYQSRWTPNPVTEGTVAGAAGAGLARGMADGLMGGKRFKLTFHDCMIDKGYTHRRPPEAEWKPHKKLKKTERQAQIFAWSSGPEPLHPIAPREEFD